MKRRVKHSKNNVGPQVRRLRFLRGWSQTDFATKLQLAGLDIDRSGVSKIEARMVFVADRTLLYLADVLKVELPELFPKREPGRRIHDYVAQLETTRF
jgi:transcriptional regulator with XRE-family HTH domain